MSMEEKGNHQNLGTPTFCRNGCGFYAAQAFDGMCSKCYKDVKQQLQEPEGQVVPTSPSQTPMTPPGGPQVDDVDAVAAALSRTSLGEMNVNTSSNNPHPGSPSSSSSESIATTSEKLAGGTIGAVSEVDTASPTVPSTAAVSAKTGSSTAVASSSRTEEDPAVAGSPDGEGTSDGDKGKKPKKNRCMECRKKVGLTGFQCHCGKLFCSLHRYSDTHDCTFDFREKGQEEIRRNNPVIKGEKVQKI
ncbi:An1-type Zinc finger protein [Plakobranchus ocellatus]|uniref:An1-type Zinc finger protein n=1 Tax=Plakobranchus ocellatus TaxID=259542 RepID=A0AAV4AIS6_9GAST|nr:An1-type Zinc finger protein [Plakobranchus ocellatus]